MKAVRRFGTSPTGRALAIAATLSHHAPAAFTTTGAANVPAPVVTVHEPPAYCRPNNSASVTVSPCCLPHWRSDRSAGCGPDFRSIQQLCGRFRFMYRDQSARRDCGPRMQGVCAGVRAARGDHRARVRLTFRASRGFQLDSSGSVGAASRHSIAVRSGTSPYR